MSQTATTTEALTYELLREAVAGAAALRARTRLQPAGGPGTKVFPPTYAGAVYAVEQRRLPGRDEPVTCVLLDSVQSQANRMEAALQDAVDGVLGEELSVRIPVIEVDFSDYGPDSNADEKLRLIDSIERVTSLQAPHRVADAILRDSVYRHNGQVQPFRKSKIGEVIDRAHLRNATPLYELCPTALVFGMWDSTGPKGGLGVKFERAMTSEIVGVDASLGTKTSSRIDPLGIALNAGPIYLAADGDGIEWTTDPEAAEKDKKGNPVLFNRGGAAGKPGNPSKANHGNITPSLSDVDRESKEYLAGGVTIEYAEQTTLLSLAALRRLRFPPEGKSWQASKQQRERDRAAQTVLAALALCAAELAAADMDLRSRCLLWPEQSRQWELLDKPGEEPARHTLGAEAAVALLREAVEAARKAGVTWQEESIRLMPSEQLVKLVRKSQEQAATEGAEEGGEG